jgi:hypothetical protein
MQIERQTTRTRYTTNRFALSTPKGKKENQGQVVFSVFVTDYSAQSSIVERKDAFETLRKIRREKQIEKKLAFL